MALVAGSFVLFTPFEEAQLVKARGQAYLDYRARVRWRVFRGIW